MQYFAYFHVLKIVRIYWHLIKYKIISTIIMEKIKTF